MTFSDRNLIFILSQPRAGSTLLQLMLGQHPDIATTAEPWIALHALYELKGGGITAEYNSGWAREAMLHFLDNSGIALSGYKGMIAGRLLHLYEKQARLQNKTFFLDKTPRYYFIAEELLEIFPEAKFVVLFRNPLAVLNSIMDSWVKDDWPRLSEYRHDLIAAPLKLLDFCEAHPDKCFRLSYEEMTGAPETTLRKLSGYLGVEYNESMLRYDRETASRWLFGDNIGVHQADAPSTRSVSKWVSGLSERNKKYMLSSYLVSLGPETVGRMGYDYGSLSDMTGLPECLPGNPWEVLTRDNSSLYNSIGRAYWAAVTSGRPNWPLCFIYSAALFGINYYESEPDGVKSGWDFWRKFFAQYTGRFWRLAVSRIKRR